MYKYVRKAYIKAWRTFRFDLRLTYLALVSFWGVCSRLILGGGVYDSRMKMYVSIVKSEMQININDTNKVGAPKC